MKGDTTSPAQETCLECGGSCCSFKRMAVTYTDLEPGQRYDSFFLRHDYWAQLLREDGRPMDARWYVWDPPGREERFVLFECNHLEGARCGVYGERPSMCRNFECEVLQGEWTLREHEEKRAVDTVEASYGWDNLTEVTDRVNEILHRRAEAL